jgi:hypothetical protein
VDRVVEDVVEGVVVLLFRLDHLGPEATAEDVVPAAVPLVERARVLAIQVAHAVGEIRERRLDDEVVVVAEQAARMQPPAVAASNAPQDLDEDSPVPVVHEDRRVVVPFRADVVVGACCEIAKRSSHPGDRSGVGRGRTPASASRH